MNKIILIGRLTRDPEIRYSQNGSMLVARFSIAVDKKKKRDDGVTADFFNLISFGKMAEFAEKYFRRGMKIAIAGHVQTGSYLKDDIKIPFFEVVIEEQEFAESKNVGDNCGEQGYGESKQSDAICTIQQTDRKNGVADSMIDSDGFMNIPDNLEEELPFQ